jgi:hypothetical protein
MENYCPPQLSIIENYAIMEPARIDHYKKYFEYEYLDRHVSIVFDEEKIHIDKFDNFPAIYDQESDNYIQATTYMIKSVYVGWWFIIQICFHNSFSNLIIHNELDKIHKFVVEEFGLRPVLYLGDMACKYLNKKH